MDLFFQTGSIILLIFGFGFVVFFHELGHFLAAKWVGIRVEQFAVGFGQAICSWRPGMGFRWGSSARELEQKQHAGADTSGYGETEYRINWIPLGGYVKMLGQDDLKPGATADDPRAFNRKSVPARMLVVSAGVIMNVILAAIGFMVVFLMGFKAPPAVVGALVPGSPAQTAVTEAGQLAPLQVGDKILYYDDQYQHDFTKITLNVALSEQGASVPMYVQRADGRREHLRVTPDRMDPKGFLMLGIGQPQELRAPEDPQQLADELLDPEVAPPEWRLLKPGDVITAVAGEPVQPDQYYMLDRALQASGGKPVKVTVKDAGGQTRSVMVQPHFAPRFKNDLNFAGMVPRAAILSLAERTSVRGKLRPGDAIVSVTSAGDVLANPTPEQFREWVGKAGAQGRTVDVTVLRDGQTVALKDVPANARLGLGQYGMGVQLTSDENTPVVAATIQGSPAEAVDAGALITAVNGQPVKSWFDVQSALASADADQPVQLAAQVPGADGKPIQKQYTLRLGRHDLAFVRENRYQSGLLLDGMDGLRKTSNPIVAAGWGVTETRDFILQFYLTLQRMFQGSVSYKNMMGPVGIVQAGAHFAFKGVPWLLWFLAMISANLAVVNFLPIPVVDGGLFTFLILEKVQGKPLSQRTQSIAQVVGLALILGVFLLVTYQDIVRLMH